MLTLMKSLVQPKIDYCSQLCSPTDQGSINKSESVQRQDHRLHGLNYWEKLKELHLYSQERRHERYRVIFLWKISQGLVSGYDVEFSSGGLRRGRHIIPKTVNRSAPVLVSNARESSLGGRGPSHLIYCQTL